MTGSRVTLDGDYVLGREPVLDFDVMAGRARPLRISDPEGTVSRLHLRVSLVGWQVEVSDLGSANGSVLRAPGEERTLAPFEPIVLSLAHGSASGTAACSTWPTKEFAHECVDRIQLYPKAGRYLGTSKSGWSAREHRAGSWRRSAR